MSTNQKQALNYNDQSKTIIKQHCTITNMH